MYIGDFIENILWKLDKFWVVNSPSKYQFTYGYGNPEFNGIKINKEYVLIVYLNYINKLLMYGPGHYKFNDKKYERIELHDYMREFIYYHAKKNNVTDEFEIIFNLNGKDFK